MVDRCSERINLPTLPANFRNWKIGLKASVYVWNSSKGPVALFKKDYETNFRSSSKFVDTNLYVPTQNIHPASNHVVRKLQAGMTLPRVWKDARLGHFEFYTGRIEDRGSSPMRPLVPFPTPQLQLLIIPLLGYESTHEASFVRILPRWPNSGWRINICHYSHLDICRLHHDFVLQQRASLSCRIRLYLLLMY